MPWRSTGPRRSGVLEIPRQLDLDETKAITAPILRRSGRHNNNNDSHPLAIRNANRYHLPAMDSQHPSLGSIDLAHLASLLKLREGLGIVHHVPGRIRLRFGLGMLTLAQDEGLAPDQAVRWLRALPGVKGARINVAAASVVVDYDPRRLDPSRWETLVLGDDDAALELVLGLLGEG